MQNSARKRIKKERGEKKRIKGESWSKDEKERATERKG